MPKIHFLSYISLDFDADYIPHLLRYYAAFSAITDFRLILHSTTDKTSLVRSVDERPLFVEHDDEPFLGPRKVKVLNGLIASVPRDDWILLADADELIEFERSDIGSLVADPDADSYYGEMLDRIAGDGRPKKIDLQPSLFEQFPRTAKLTRDLGGSAIKPVLFRARPLLNAHSLVDPPLGPWPVSATIHHFKWTNSTRGKLEKRVRDYRRAGLEWWRESAQALEMFYKDGRGDMG